MMMVMYRSNCCGLQSFPNQLHSYVEVSEIL
jgi:hypothetical protein